MASTGRGKRLRTYKKVVPLPAGKLLAPRRPADLPASKFKDTPGQMAMDLDGDDPGALLKPEDYIEP